MKKSTVLLALVSCGLSFASFAGETSANQPAAAVPDVSKTYPMAEVAKHGNKDSCWFVVNDKVFDVTGFVPKHPGGKKDILSNCGKNVTKAFSTQGGEGKHSPKADGLLAGMQIGVLGK